MEKERLAKLKEQGLVLGIAPVKETEEMARGGFVAERSMFGSGLETANWNGANWNAQQNAPQLLS